MLLSSSQRAVTHQDVQHQAAVRHVLDALALHCGRQQVGGEDGGGVEDADQGESCDPPQPGHGIGEAQHASANHGCMRGVGGGPGRSRTSGMVPGNPRSCGDVSDGTEEERNSPVMMCAQVVNKVPAREVRGVGWGWGLSVEHHLGPRVSYGSGP